MYFMGYIIFLLFVDFFAKAEWEHLEKKKFVALCMKFSKQNPLLCEITLDFPCSLMVNMDRKKISLTHYYVGFKWQNQRNAGLAKF